MTNIQRLIEKIYNKPLEEVLRQMYLVDDLPVYKIAEQLGVSHTTVHRWIREYDFHYKRPIWNKGLSKTEMQRIIEMNK